MRKEKSWFTDLTSCNEDVSEKFPIMFIRSSFGSKYRQEHELDYHVNEMARMSMDLFFEWLHRFNNYIGRTHGRNRILLVHNYSAHGILCALPQLNKFGVEFLPPNNSSRIQSLEAGIIATVKPSFHRPRSIDVTFFIGFSTILT